MKKAVYYLCDNFENDRVSPLVLDVLKEEGYLNLAGFTFDGRDVKKYVDSSNNEYYFVPTAIPLCLDYPKYLGEMNKYFGNFDMAGMITWHEGASAPEKILTIHTAGDVNSGVFGNANPLCNRNILKGMEKHKKKLGLDNFKVVTEATHWSGIVDGQSDATLICKYPVPIVDIEIGSELSSWQNRDASRALARSLMEVFSEDLSENNIVHNLLCVGGIHFDPNFAEAVVTRWNDDKESFGISHILANQWLVSAQYENNDGVEKITNSIESIINGIDAIVFHDKLKGCYKDLVRMMGEKYKVPILKHQLLRNPETIKWN